jgi:hypothetical protein
MRLKNILEILAWLGEHGEELQETEASYVGFPPKVKDLLVTVQCDHHDAYRFRTVRPDPSAYCK